MTGAVTIPMHSIAASAAHAMVAAAVGHGTAHGCAVVAVVVDPAGATVALLRGDGAPLESSGIARDKAYTAAAFRAPSNVIEGALAANPALRDSFIARAGLALFGGGLPIVIDGAVVGAIGVSGGTEEFDQACATAGLAAVGAGPSSGV